MRLLGIIAGLAVVVLLAGCERRDSLEQIQRDGVLQVISRNSPTTYYLDRNGPTGFEYALASLLAEELGVELKLRPAFSLQEIFTSLSRGESDLAAAGLTLTPLREALYPHSIPYFRLTPQVVYMAGSYRPSGIEDIGELRLAVLSDSSHADALRELRDGAHPDLQWREIEGADTMELLELVIQGEADLAVIDSNEFQVQQSLYPRLKVAFDLRAEQEMVWYLPPDTDNTRLLVRINNFIQRLQRDGTLNRLRELHFGHTAGISRISSHTFNRNMRQDLPPYRPLIQQVAREYKMDWHLLAAIAYQESHWDPQATSPTGVRGMMMLTLPTARELGVGNRLDAAESLRGGAQYYMDMKRRLPADIDEPDRTWMALAAYNIGLGHLDDARILTEAAGGDPHLWRDVMKHLPLLQKSSYYKKLRYGFARGQEAVTYVQNIRHYYSILAWQEIPGNKATPPLRTGEYFPEVVSRLRLRAL